MTACLTWKQLVALPIDELEKTIVDAEKMLFATTATRNRVSRLLMRDMAEKDRKTLHDLKRSACFAYMEALKYCEDCNMVFEYKALNPERKGIES